MNIWKKHKNDILLILAVLLLAGGAWLWMRLSRSEGGEAVVTVDGVEVWRAPLSAPQRWDYVDESGVVRNRIVIEDGAVRVEEADCPDRVCVRTGKARYDGQVIVCLPHRLIVRVVGGADGPDAVTS